jgi:microcompartment protein CcmL/EutN
MVKFSAEAACRAAADRAHLEHFVVIGRPAENVADTAVTTYLDRDAHILP